MAALARYYKSKGLPVAGYDRTESALTDELVAEGITVSYADSMDAVPQEYRDPQDTLVVYTPAIPAENVALSFFREGGFELYKRARVLGGVTRDSKSLCFSGTHGKTTTSSMAAHIMHCGPVGCNAFLGGILRGLQQQPHPERHFALQRCRSRRVRPFVPPAHPYIAIVNATDPDHLDIYGTEEATSRALPISQN